MTTEKIITATDSDKVLRGVRAAINLNKWDFNIVKSCKATKDELTVTSKGTLLILRSQCYSKKGVKKKGTSSVDFGSTFYLTNRVKFIPTWVKTTLV